MAHDVPPQREASVGPDLLLARMSRRKERYFLMIGDSPADDGGRGHHCGPNLGTFSAAIVEKDQPAADKFNVLRLAERAGERVRGFHDRTLLRS